MADRKITQLESATRADSGDLLHLVTDPDGTPANKRITVEDFFDRVSVDVTLSENVEVEGNLVINKNTLPGADAEVPIGTILFHNDGVDDFIYVKTGTTTFKRIGLQDV